MELHALISGWTKAVTCFALALALVLSPPSAAHAASGMHVEHQTKSAEAIGAAVGHDAGSEVHHSHTNHRVIEDTTIEVSDRDGKTQQSDECCNGICISVVFLEDTKVRVEPVGTREYAILDGQTYSVETSGLLRPPQFLI